MLGGLVEVVSTNQVLGDIYLIATKPALVVGRQRQLTTRIGCYYDLTFCHLQYVCQFFSKSPVSILSRIRTKYNPYPPVERCVVNTFDIEKLQK